MSNPTLDVQPTFYDLLFRFLELDDEDAVPEVETLINTDLVGIRDVVRGAAVRTREITDSATLVLADQGKVVEANKATAISLTVPDNADVAFPVGTVIRVCQTGAGALTFVADTAVTINAVGGDLVSEGQWITFELRKRATDTWLLNRLI